MTLYERDWQNICKKERKIEKTIKVGLAKSTLATTPSVTLSGQTVTINGVKYECKTKADNLTEQQKKNKKYFPAVLYKDTVYVDPLHSLSNTTAKLFVYANNSKIGIWATSSSYAKGLCGGNNAIWHNTHCSDVFLRTGKDGAFQDSNQTLEDLCFFSGKQLFVGTVSHEFLLSVDPLNKEFEEFMGRVGNWNYINQGFKKVSQNGSHVKWKKGDKSVTVPNHGPNREIPIGTLRNIWRQAGWI